MNFDIGMWLLWILFAFIVAIYGSIKQRDDMWEFINRFSFIGFADTIVFVVLSYFNII